MAAQSAAVAAAAAAAAAAALHHNNPGMVLDLRQVLLKRHLALTLKNVNNNNTRRKSRW